MTQRATDGGGDAPSAPIRSSRLDLIPMSRAFLEATVAGDLVTAGAVLGAEVPDVWLAATDLAALRLGQMTDADLEPWLLRAIVARATGSMVGHIGFHGPPGMAHLDAWLPGAAEFGFTVFEDHRRLGYAREASVALMDWATDVHGVTDFVLTIAPGNTASQTLAAGLGFRRLGSWDDPDDGPEDILGLTRRVLQDERWLTQ